MLAGSRLLVEIAVKHQNNSWLYYEIWARLCTQTRYTIVSICLLPNLAFLTPQIVCLLAEERKLMIALVEENDFWFWIPIMVSYNAAYATQPKARGWARCPKRHSTSVPVFPNKRGQSLPSICKSQFHEATPPLPPEHTASGQTNLHGKGHRW